MAIKREKPTEWAPHYTGGFSPRQEAQINAEQYAWVDSRGLHQLLTQQGLEVVLQGNPGDYHNGTIILARLDGYYVEVPKSVEGDEGITMIEWSDGTVVGYAKCQIKILSITIPLGVSKLSYVLKMYAKKGVTDRDAPKRMYVY